MPKGGPRGGERFREEWQPVMGLLWDELDKNYWKEVAVTGPVQASKSFGALVIPTLRDIVELQYSPILGVPEADMFADKWDRDFKPVLEESEELRWLLPSFGSGQRGGRVRDRITFDNGTDLKVMSRGGQASNKAGYTTPRLRITEAAGFSNASSSERDNEADSFRQLVSRLGAFDLMDPRRLVLIEGTGTVAEDLPWRLRGEDDDEQLISTRSRIVAECPHCHAWISPEREHLHGWQNAETVRQAYEQAVFLCHECNGAIDDHARNKMMQECRLVHFGQEVTEDGEVVGPLPEVFRLWFRYSSFHNLLINAGTLAVTEWEAKQLDEGTEDAENAERHLCQKVWAVPFKSKLADQEPLKPTVLRKKTDEWPRNVLPVETKGLVIGIDCGKWNSHWCALSWRGEGPDLRFHIPAYGIFPVMRDGADVVDAALLHALRAFRDEIGERGFPQEGSDGMSLPDAVGIDNGYLPDVIAAFLRESGNLRRSRYRSCRGRGSSIMNGRQHTQVKKRSESKPLAGEEWYGEINHERRTLEVTFNADHFKLLVHERFRAGKDRKGSITIYAAETPQEHARFSNHIVNEQLVEKWEPGKGIVKKWVKSGENHFLDALAIAFVMHDMVQRRKKPKAKGRPSSQLRDDDSGFAMPDGRPFLELG